MEQMTGLLQFVGGKRTLDSDTTIAEFVLCRTTGGAYPNVAFVAMGKAVIEKLNAIAPDSLVKVDYEIQGRGTIGKDGLPKYYNTLRAFDITPVTNSIVSPVVGIVHVTAEPASNNIVQPVVENTPAVIEQKVEVEK